MGVQQLDIQWAVDVAMALRRRGVTDSGSEKSSDVMTIVNVLCSQPPPSTWHDVVRSVDATKRTATTSQATIRKRITRIQELLIRASAQLNTDAVGRSAQFRSWLRITNEITTAQLLLESGSAESAKKMFQHAIGLSEKYGIAETAIQSLAALRRISANTDESVVIELYSKRIAKHSLMLATEIEAERLTDHARVLLRQYTMHRSMTLRTINQICVKLQSIRRRYVESHRISYSCLRVHLWRASLIGDAVEMNRLGREGVQYMNSHPFTESIQYRVEFEGSRLSAALICKNHAEAHRSWTDMQRKIAVGSGNWVTLLQIYFLVCVATRQYGNARDAVCEYQLHCKRGGALWRKRLWQLYRAYIMFLIDQEVIAPGPMAGAPRVYAAVLERQYAELMDDKPVGGAAVLVLKVLQWLRAGRYSDIIENTDRIRQHASRYLRNPQTARTGAFMRMLATLPAAEFDPDLVGRRGAAIWERHPEAHSLKHDTAEIIPYEDLWAIVLKMLES